MNGLVNYVQDLLAKVGCGNRFEVVIDNSNGSAYCAYLLYGNPATKEMYQVIALSSDYGTILGRIALPQVIYHEIGHLIDEQKHGELRETLFQKRKDEIFADLASMEYMIDTNTPFPRFRCFVAFCIRFLLWNGIYKTLKEFFIKDERGMHPNAIRRFLYSCKHYSIYRKAKKKKGQ